MINIFCFLALEKGTYFLYFIHSFFVIISLIPFGSISIFTTIPKRMFKIEMDEKEIESMASVHSRETLRDDEAMKKHDLESQLSLEIDNSKLEPSGQESTDPNIVNWDGPDDPANPMNWSSKEKITAIGIVSLITLLS